MSINNRQSLSPSSRPSGLNVSYRNMRWSFNPFGKSHNLIVEQRESSMTAHLNTIVFSTIFAKIKMTLTMQALPQNLATKKSPKTMEKTVFNS
jgi:hypothetical protein